jgi:SAM-dependent methyltransferase
MSTFYSKYIFPRVCDWALDQPFVASWRRTQLAAVRGEILEIGVGTGLNLPCYPSHVRKITTVEPNPGTNKRRRKRIEQTGIEVDERVIRGEELPFPDDSFDFVVSSFTLCSISKVDDALQQIQRVLKPGGCFVFLEHGLSPEPKVQKWQRRLNWIQGICGDGCRLDLDLRRHLSAIPFSSVEIDNFYLERTPRPHGYMYRGTAIV